MSKTFGKRAEDIKWQDDIMSLCLHIHNRLGIVLPKVNMEKGDTSDDVWDVIQEELEGLFPGLDYRNYN